MKKLYEKLRDTTKLRNCKLLAPFIFLFYYPMRKKYAIEDVEKFVGTDIPKREKNRLARKIVWNKILYHFEADGFFYFHLENRSCKEKKKYIADCDHEEYAWKMNSDPEKRHILDDKMETYKVYGKFYKRDVCFVPCSSDGKRILAEFVNKHPKFIAKTLDGSCGQGIAVFDLKDYASDEELCSAVFDKYWDDFLVEELVIQSGEMAKLNPSSVNTVRIHTFRVADRIETRYSLVRIGREGSVVDNGGAGGIISFLDEKSGEIYSTADEFGRSYSVHPDSGVPIIGFKVPNWEDIRAFAIELAQVVPENRYVGWDIAITDNGYIMIEGNAQAQFVGPQMKVDKGLKDELNEIMREMGIKC